jgi:hypothetical protein
MAERPKHAGYEVLELASGLNPRRTVRLQAFMHHGRRYLHMEVAAPPQCTAYVQLAPDEAMAVAKGCFGWSERLLAEVGRPAEVPDGEPEAEDVNPPLQGELL